MSGGFTVTSNIIDNRTLHAEFIGKFTSENPEKPGNIIWPFGNGKFELIADDSSMLILTANNGDPDTVTIWIFKFSNLTN